MRGQSVALTPSPIHSHFAGRDMRTLELTAADISLAAVGELSAIGISLPQGAIMEMVNGLRLASNLPVYGMDAAPDLQPLITTASLGAPLQFLQAWLPGLVHLMTAARKMDEIVGVTTIGSWEDEEIIQGVLEPTGLPQPYGDSTGVPLASWNLNYERRSIIRFEEGMEVGILEAARTAKMRVDTAAQKRSAAGLALDILRNRIGFYGYNAGLGRTYGFLNDPASPAYVNVAAGTWATKDFQGITGDVREVAAALQTNTQDTFDPFTQSWTMAIATAAAAYLSVTTDFGQSVRAWLKATFPGLRIVSAPELNAANGGANVLIAFADMMNDGVSDDDGKTWLQMVPVKFRTIGAEKRIKSYVEDYSNALAGVMLKRPFAVVRRSGI